MKLLGSEKESLYTTGKILGGSLNLRVLACVLRKECLVAQWETMMERDSDCLKIVAVFRP